MKQGFHKYLNVRISARLNKVLENYARGVFAQTGIRVTRSWIIRELMILGAPTFVNKYQLSKERIQARRVQKSGIDLDLLDPEILAEEASIDSYR